MQNSIRLLERFYAIYLDSIGNKGVRFTFTQQTTTLQKISVVDPFPSIEDLINPKILDPEP